MKYSEYLQSDHWHNLKMRKAKKSPKQCAICGGRGRIDCHHLLYKNLLDVTTADLRWLCRRCHDKAHEVIRAGKVRPQRKNRANPQALFILTKHAVLRELRA